MRKVLGFTLALVFMFTLSAVAEEVVMGKVKAIDPSDKSIMLEDGTKLSVSDSQISGLVAGEQVRAMYEIEGGKRVVTGFDFHTVGSDARGSVGFTAGSPVDSMQAE